MNFNTICRVCMEERAGLQFIFKASLVKMLMACASIIIVDGDGLPTQICVQCITSVSRAYRFKQLCEKSDAILRRYLNSTKFSDDSVYIKPECLLTTSLTSSHSSVYNDLFSVNNSSLNDPLIVSEPSTLSADISALEQCLPSLWSSKCNNTDFVASSLSETLLNPPSLCGERNWTEDVKNDMKEQNDLFECKMKSLQKRQDIIDNNQDVIEKRYMCSLCGNRYKEHKTLKLHIRSHTGERPLKCEICDKSFALPSSLNRHRNFHIGDKKHKCSVCGKEFLQLSNLNVHKKKHTGLKLFSCTICQKQFTMKTYLTNHLRIHSGEKPFSCQLCDMSFGTSSQLSKHKLKHTFERLYDCSQCGKQFRAKKTRDEHMRCHTGEKPFTCSVCQKNFVTRSRLREHIVCHSREKKHQCVVCNKLFLRKRHVKAHMYTHTGEKPFCCFTCGRTFSNSGSLSNHMRGHSKG